MIYGTHRLVKLVWAHGHDCGDTMRPIGLERLQMDEHGAVHILGLEYKDQLRAHGRIWDEERTLRKVKPLEDSIRVCSNVYQGHIQLSNLLVRAGSRVTGRQSELRGLCCPCRRIARERRDISEAHTSDGITGLKRVSESLWERKSWDRHRRITEPSH